MTGDVRLLDPTYPRGVEWTVKRVRRAGRRGCGAWIWIWDLARMGGDVAVENDFGRTRFLLDESWPSDLFCDRSLMQ